MGSRSSPSTAICLKSNPGSFSCTSGRMTMLPNSQKAFARHLTKWRLRGAEQTSRRDTLWLAELVGVECGYSSACDARLFCCHLVHLRGARNQRFALFGAPSPFKGEVL